MAHEDLVERPQLLSVVRARLHHCPVEVCRPPAGDVGEQVGDGRARVRNEGAAATHRIDADNRLSVKVFRDIGHQAVLADGDDDVVGPEDESREFVPLGLPAPPLHRDRGEHSVPRRIQGVMAGE